MQQASKKIIERLVHLFTLAILILFCLTINKYNSNIATVVSIVGGVYFFQIVGSISGLIRLNKGHQYSFYSGLIVSAISFIINNDIIHAVSMTLNGVQYITPIVSRQSWLFQMESMDAFVLRSGRVNAIIILLLAHGFIGGFVTHFFSSFKIKATTFAFYSVAIWLLLFISLVCVIPPGLDFFANMLGANSIIINILVHVKNTLFAFLIIIFSFKVGTIVAAGKMPSSPWRSMLIASIPLFVFLTFALMSMIQGIKNKPLSKPVGLQGFARVNLSSPRENKLHKASIKTSQNQNENSCWIKLHIKNIIPSSRHSINIRIFDQLNRKVIQKKAAFIVKGNEINVTVPLENVWDFCEGPIWLSVGLDKSFYLIDPLPILIPIDNYKQGLFSLKINFDFTQH